MTTYSFRSCEMKELLQRAVSAITRTLSGERGRRKVPMLRNYRIIRDRHGLTSAAASTKTEGPFPDAACRERASYFATLNEFAVELGKLYRLFVLR